MTDTVVVWGRANCHFCTMAVCLLEELEVSFAYHSVDEWSREEILKKFPGAKTVPIIEVNGEWIGGYTELKKFLEKR